MKRYLIRASFIEPTVGMFFPEADSPEEAEEAVRLMLKDTTNIQILENTETDEEAMKAFFKQQNHETKGTVN